MQLPLSVGPCVLSWSVFKYLREIFSNFCIKLGHYKDTKVTEPDLESKPLGFINGGKSRFRGIFDFWSISLHPVLF